MPTHRHSTETGVCGPFMRLRLQYQSQCGSLLFEHLFAWTRLVRIGKSREASRGSGRDNLFLFLLRHIFTFFGAGSNY